MSEVPDLLAASYDAAVAHGDPVLSYLDADGNPASVRVKVARGADGLDVTLPGGAPTPADGPANLLAHSHNEDLWDLHQTMVRGSVRVEGANTRFAPARIVPGARPGLRNGVKIVRRCRRSAEAELERRGLARPAIPWDAVRRVAQRASES